MTKWVFASILCFMHAFSFGQRIYVQDHVVVEQSATFKSAVSTLSDFSNVSELKYGLKYDPDYLQLDSVLLTNIFNAGGLDIIHDEEKGLISFWFGREGTFALFSRNMVSYEFKAIGENLSCTELEFVAHEDGSEIYLVNNEITYTQDQFNIGNGSVYIKNLEEDPVVQRDYSAGIKPPLTAKINLDLPGCIHPNGAIGTDFYLQSCGDRSIKKIGRSGQELEGFGFDDFFDFFGPFEVAVPNEGSIIYDHVNESWILIEVFDDGNQATKVQVVLLKDDEGLELIHKTTIELPRNIWNPSFVLWKDKIVLSTRDIYVEEFLFFFINLNDLRNGVENPRKNSLRIPIDAAYHFNHIISPATANNPNGLASNSPIALSLRDDDWYKEDGDYVEIMEFDIDWESAAPALKLTKIPLAPFNTQSLESIYSSSFGGDPDFVKSMILNPPQYYKFSNHESLVFCFTTDVNTEDNEYGIRWLELQRVEGGEWVKHQESTFAIPGRIRYFPSIAIDDKQNILLSYNTNASFASIDLAITGRRKEDPLNKMTFEENILRYGSGNFPNPSKHNLNSNQISLDKNENGFFWFTSNFSGGNCLAGVDFQTDNLDLGLVEITDLEELAIYDEENKIKLRIKNRGLDEVENYLVKVYLNEELVIEEERKDAFAFLEERIVELDQRLVFPEVGKYLIRVELELEGDELVLNNSLNAIVKRIEKHSAHINLMSVDGDCSTSENGSELRFEIINSGFENIDKAEILISLNNQLVEQFVQEMPIAYQEKMNFELLIEEEFEDENEYEITITEVESQGQIIPLNESISFPYHRSDEVIKVLDLGIHVGEQGDISWSIKELETGILVASGGPYAEESELLFTRLCLSPYDCYLFELHNAALDERHGSYFLRTNLNYKLIDEGPGTAKRRVHGFCLDAQQCQIKPNIILSPALNLESEDGRIEIELLNRVEQFEYRLGGIGPFVADPVFDDLMTGDYIVEVRSVDGECEYEEVIYLDHLGLVGLKDFSSKGDLKIKPNPATDMVHISFKKTDSVFEKSASVELYDGTGKQVSVSKLQWEEDGFRLSVQHLPKGIYLIKVNTPELSHVGKVIKN